jgi:hypothetical protein
MLHKLPPKITLSAFLDSILIHSSSAAEKKFQATPHFDRLSQSRVAWGEVRKVLDEPTIESYENAVNRAFADYEALLKDYFWSLGLISIVEKPLSAGDGSEQQQNTPNAIIAAEDKLKQVYNQFSELLSVESREKFNDYFQQRKSAVDIVGAYCCRNGMDFMNTLLTQVGLNNEQNGEEVSHSAL